MQLHCLVNETSVLSSDVVVQVSAWDEAPTAPAQKSPRGEPPGLFIV